MRLITECLDPISLFDPIGSLVSGADISRHGRGRPQADGPLPLPLDVLLMVLERTSSQSTVNFFSATAEAHSLAPEFCRTHPWHFYPSIQLGDHPHQIWSVINAIHRVFTGDEFLCLDKRWAVHADIQSLSRLITSIVRDTNLLSSWNAAELVYPPSDPKIYCGVAVELPGNVTSVEVHTRTIRGNNYVCGLR